MAALTLTELTRRLPVGDRVIQTWRATTNATPANGTEWIATGLTEIEAVLGVSVIGQSAGAAAAAPVAATTTIVADATATDTDTVTIDGIVYTFTQTLTAVAGPHEVEGGASLTASLANLAHAINGTGTPGTSYGLATPPHPSVKASASTNTLTLTARVPGTVGNGIVVAGDDTGWTFNTPTAGGLDPAESLTPSIVCRKNARGTSVAEGTNLGDLGVESAVASVVFEVTVVGRP